jgi:hypothetical protein
LAAGASTGTPPRINAPLPARNVRLSSPPFISAEDPCYGAHVRR